MMAYGPVRLSYNPPFSACFLSRNNVSACFFSEANGAYSRKRLRWEPPSTKHGEWFASTFVLPTVHVIQFQASTSQHSSTMEVMYKTMTDSSMLALQFYNMMIEYP